MSTQRVSDDLFSALNNSSAAGRSTTAGDFLNNWEDVVSELATTGKAGKVAL